MRRTFLLLTLVGVFLLATTGVLLAQTTNGDTSNQRSGDKAPLQKEDKGSIPGQYIVVLNDNVTSASDVAKKHTADAGFRPDFVYEKALKGYATKLSDAQLDKVRSKPEVKFVSLDHKVEATQKSDSTTEKDSSSSTQSSSEEGVTAQGLVPITPGDSTPTGVKRINAATSTQAAERSDVNVAVLDSGIDLGHPDLNANPGKNCDPSLPPDLPPDQVPPPDDETGHGTHVAGTIGAKNNGSGVIGVAPGTKLYAARVLNKDGGGRVASLICGVDWVTGTRTDNVTNNDISVANISIRGIGWTNDNNCGKTNGDPLHTAICNSTNAGVTYVVGAANDNRNFSGIFPADYPEVLTVTAMADYNGQSGGGAEPICNFGEPDDAFANFSNYAADGSAEEAHTIAAPGVCIKSTWPSTLGDRSGYNFDSGTSMATPHTSGSVANCISNGKVAGPCKSLTPAQIISKVRSDAQTHANPSNGFSGDPLHPVVGKYFGYLVDDTVYLSARVTSTSPKDGATNVDRDNNIKAKFSEKMMKSSINGTTVYLTSGSCNDPSICATIPAKVSYSAKTKRATLNPTDRLAANTQYTATVMGGSSGVKDSAGNEMATDKVWHFTTGAN